MMTAKQYLKSLRKLNLSVYLLGKRIASPLDEPILRPSANAVAKTYELAFDPENEELMCAVSHLTGRKINRFTHIHQSADDLVKKTLSVEEKLSAITDYFLEQYEQRPELVHIFITELSRSSVNLTPDRLDQFKKLMSRTEGIMREAQKAGHLRDDLKPSYLTFFFLGAVEALLSTMVLENQKLKSDSHKKRLTQAVLAMFLDGAKVADR